jgi:riboflavin biosynthesis pyrimidine reductase
LGVGGERLFTWLFDGDTPNRFNPRLKQCLRAGLMDELVISLVPVVLGRGVRLLDGLEPGSVALDLVRVIDAPGVTHLHYRVVK